MRILAYVLFAFVALPSISQQDRNTQNPAVPGKAFTLTQVWTLDATYSDEQHGVTFRYPRIWKPTAQFGYNPPALTQETPKPIAGFGYEEGGFPRDRVVGPYSTTNLEGFGIVYSAAPAANTAECDARANSISEMPEHRTPEHRTVVFGGRAFSMRETGEGGCRSPIQENSTQRTCTPTAIYSKRMWPQLRWMISVASRQHNYA